MKTRYKKNQEKREDEIAAYVATLMAEPKAMKTAVEIKAMVKFSIYSRSTVWNICNRVAKRNQPANQQAQPATIWQPKS